MMSVNISELKSHLSRYLRRVASGERILVLDRKEPVAEIVPVPAGRAGSARERLAAEGRLRLARRDLASLRFRRLDAAVSIQESLREVRGER